MFGLWAWIMLMSSMYWVRFAAVTVWFMNDPRRSGQNLGKVLDADRYIEK
jgi:hypothetical protein